jgi:hypothetical protein
MSKIYKFPEVLVEMGKDAEGGVDPRPKWEIADPKYMNWYGIMDGYSYISSHLIYRRKQKTVTVNVDGVDYELPMPETKAIKRHADYYALDAFSNRGYASLRSFGDNEDIDVVKNRAVHLSEENVKAWAKFWNDAIISKIKECE